MSKLGVLRGSGEAEAGHLESGSGSKLSKLMVVYAALALAMIGPIDTASADEPTVTNSGGGTEGEGPECEIPGDYQCFGYNDDGECVWDDALLIRLPYQENPFEDLGEDQILATLIDFRSEVTATIAAINDDSESCEDYLNSDTRSDYRSRVQDYGVNLPSAISSDGREMLGSLKLAARLVCDTSFTPQCSKVLSRKEISNAHDVVFDTE